MPSQQITPGGTKIQGTLRGIGTWQPSVAASGTAGGGDDTSTTNGTLYYASLWIPGDAPVTGIQYLAGNTSATTKVIVSLHDITGVLLANSDVAGQTVGTASTIVQVPFTTPYLLQGPALFLIGLTFNGTGSKFSTIPANTHLNSRAGSATQVFGTPASFTPSTTVFTVAKGPISSLY